eukprot:gene18997-24815_t
MSVIEGPKVYNLSQLNLAYYDKNELLTCVANAEQIKPQLSLALTESVNEVKYHEHMCELLGIATTPKRLHFIVPELLNRLPSHLSLAQILLCSTSALNRIKHFINRIPNATIVTTAISWAEKKLVDYLNLPMLSPEPLMSTTIHSNSFIKRQFIENKLNIPLGAFDVYTKEDLYIALSRLIKQYIGYIEMYGCIIEAEPIEKTGNVQGLCFVDPKGRITYYGGVDVIMDDKYQIQGYIYPQTKVPILALEQATVAIVKSLHKKFEVIGYVTIKYVVCFDGLDNIPKTLAEGIYLGMTPVFTSLSNVSILTMNDVAIAPPPPPPPSRVNTPSFGYPPLFKVPDGITPPSMNITGRTKPIITERPFKLTINNQSSWGAVTTKPMNGFNNNDDTSSIASSNRDMTNQTTWGAKTTNAINRSINNDDNSSIASSNKDINRSVSASRRRSQSAIRPVIKPPKSLHLNNTIITPKKSISSTIKQSNNNTPDKTVNLSDLSEKAKQLEEEIETYKKENQIIKQL